MPPFILDSFLQNRYVSYVSYVPKVNDLTKESYYKLNNEMLSIPQAARYCSISRVTLWRWVKSGDLRASLTPGGHHRILKKDLEAFIFEKGMYPLANNRSLRGRILIVDDEIGSQKVVKKMLAVLKCEMEVASDGFEAGIKVLSFRPDLIILDLFMPGMDGFGVCKMVKSNPDTAHIKVLAITGYDSKETRDRIMKLGADAYLPKLVERTTLIEQVEKMLKET